MSLVTRTPVLWALFVLTIVLGAGFGLFAPAVGGQFLDMVSAPEEVQAVLAAMTPGERKAHLWLTVLMDTAFPLSFGLLFAGLAYRFLGSLAALPGFAVLIVDLTENTIQALALAGIANVLDAKAWVTPLKMYLFYAAAAIALVAVLVAVYRLVQRLRG